MRGGDREVMDARPEGFSDGFRAAISYGRRAAGEKVASAYRVLAEAGAGASGAARGGRDPDAGGAATGVRAWRAGACGAGGFHGAGQCGRVPALVFPLAAPDGGLPLSVQLVGPAFSEGRLVGIAKAFGGGGMSLELVGGRVGGRLGGGPGGVVNGAMRCC